MENAPLVSHETRRGPVSRKPGRGLIHAVFNYDVFYEILKHSAARTDIGFRQLTSYFLVCKDFRYILKECMLRCTFLDELGPFDQVTREEGVGRLESNKNSHGSFLQMLEERPNDTPPIRVLSMCTVRTDKDLVKTQFAIMRLCSPHLTNIRLHIQQLYQARALWSVLSRVNPVSITLCGSTLSSQLDRPTWNVMDIFLVLQGCSNLRHLDITLGSGQATLEEVYREGQDLELPIETLRIHNRFWRDVDLDCLEKVRLPDIKAFKGNVGMDDGSGRCQEVLKRCFTEFWVETLVDLDLSVSTVHSSGPNRIDIFDQVPHDRLPKLKKLHVPVNLLRSRSLVALSTLEEVNYSDAGLSDLKEIKSVFQRLLESSPTLLPSMKRFEMDNCTSEPGASEYLNYIYSVFEGRNVKVMIRVNGSRN